MRSSFILSAFVVASSFALGGCQTTAGEKKKTETVMRTPTQGASVQTAQATPTSIPAGNSFAAAVAALAGAPGTGVMPVSPTANAYASAVQPTPPVYVQPQRQFQVAPAAGMIPSLPAQPVAPVYVQQMQVPQALPQPSTTQVQAAPAPAAVVAEPVRIRRF